MKGASISLVRLTVLCIEQISYIYFFLFPVPTLRYPGSWSVTCVFELFKLLFFQQQLCRDIAVSF